MKTIATAIVALGLFAGFAEARTLDGYFTNLERTAPRTIFDDLQDTAPRSIFDDIQDSAPKSIFDQIRETAPRAAGSKRAASQNLVGE